MQVEVSCEQVWREISSYLEGEVTPELRAAMEAHFKQCSRCSAVLDGTRNVVRLVGDGRSFDVPAGFGQRLYRKLGEHFRKLDEETPALPREVPLGITDQKVPLGSHLVYFWENDEEFQRGVKFLEPGLAGGEHCVVQGHDEANQRVLEILRERGHDPERLMQQGRLTVLRRGGMQQTLSDIAAVFEAAKRAGAPAIRVLGNLGVGRDPLPEGEAGIVELEAKATAVMSQYPCVLICMYDVRTLPGRLIVKGGLANHPLTVCSDGMHPNPHFVPEVISRAKSVQ